VARAHEHEGVKKCRTYGARGIFLLVSPALTGWAKLCRAYGASAGCDPQGSSS